MILSKGFASEVVYDMMLSRDEYICVYHPVSEEAAFERAARWAYLTGLHVLVSSSSDKHVIIGGVVPYAARGNTNE